MEHLRFQSTVAMDVDIFKKKRVNPSYELGFATEYEPTPKKGPLQQPFQDIDFDASYHLTMKATSRNGKHKQLNDEAILSILRYHLTAQAKSTINHLAAKGITFTASSLSICSTKDRSNNT
jgi:hypothetical protein